MPLAPPWPPRPYGTSEPPGVPGWLPPNRWGGPFPQTADPNTPTPTPPAPPVPSPVPAVTPTFGPALFGAFQPWLTPDLQTYLTAIASMFSPTWDLVNDVSVDGQPDFIPGHGQLFDIDLCPTAGLGYLGQFVGVQIPAGASDATARALVRAESGMARGTLGSIGSAVERSISTVWTPYANYVTNQIVSYQATPGVPAAYYQALTSFQAGATFNPGRWQAIDITSQYQIIERLGPSGADAYWISIYVNYAQLTPPSNTAQLIANLTANKPAGILLNIQSSALPEEWYQATLTWAATANSVTWATLQNGQV